MIVFEIFDVQLFLLSKNLMDICFACLYYALFLPKHETRKHLPVAHHSCLPHTELWRCAMSTQDIHIFAKNGDISSLTSLINSRASFDIQDEGGFTPLHWAAYYGHSSAVRILVDAKATVDAQDNDGRAPLHIAAKNGHKDAVQVLVDSGATITICDFWGRTPLLLAQNNGEADTADVLRAAEMAQHGTVDK